MEYRQTKQREQILQFLRNNHGHHSAEEIYEGVNKEANISLATIYRNLNILEEVGEIKKIALDNGYVYDKTQDPHYHFYCEKCHKLYDVDSDYDEANIHHLKKVVPGKVNEHDIIIRGVCDNCLKKHPK